MRALTPFRIAFADDDARTGPVYELDDDSASSGSSAMYDSDDDVWHDALEKPSVPRAPVRLPEELLDMIMAATQEPWGDLPTLEACSVVCKEWSLPARRRCVSPLSSIETG